MSTLTFPSIEPPVYPLEEQYEDNSISSAMEDGTVTGRRKFTKSRTTWTLKWTALPDSDHTLLMDFIRKTVYFKSLSFAWTNPQTETTHEVRCIRRYVVTECLRYLVRRPDNHGGITYAGTISGSKIRKK